MDITHQVITNKPVPIIDIKLETVSEYCRVSETDMFAIDKKMFGMEFLSCVFRSVSIDRLAYVLKKGVDVLPTNSVIYADYLDKAMEYGGWPKVIMAFYPKRMQRTFKEVDSTIAEDELAELMKIYPTKIESKDGSRYWHTKLDENDNRIATDYEISYAWWIPNSPWDCLKMILLLRRPHDEISLGEITAR